MKVCYFGTYRETYSRNQIMIEGLRRNGVEVIECHVALWQGEADRVSVASGGWLSVAFLWRVFVAYAQLLWQYAHIEPYDILILGYPGHFDVFLAWILAKLGRKPLVWDVFMSLYLIAKERGLVEKHPFTGKVLHWLEKQAYRLPDLLIQDTEEYVTWFEQNFGIQSNRFSLVPTGADDRFFAPIEAAPPDDKFHILYYGTFIPNHGVPHIIEAAKLLQDKADICFDLVGDGVMRTHAMTLAKKYQLKNVIFTGWIDKQDLPLKMAQADVCLGAFGTTPQSLMTVQNKIYECLAMGKPVITGDSPTVQRTLVHKKHVYLCERADPESLAQAVLALKTDTTLRQELTEKGHHLYKSQYDLQHNGARYATHLTQVVSQRAKSAP